MFTVVSFTRTPGPTDIIGAVRIVTTGRRCEPEGAHVIRFQVSATAPALSISDT
jgi:hypothetical protein